MADTARLFLVHGEPSLTEQERFLLSESKRLLEIVDGARDELAKAVAEDDAELCVAAARRFLGLGLVFADRARFSV